MDRTLDGLAAGSFLEGPAEGKEVVDRELAFIFENWTRFCCKFGSSSYRLTFGVFLTSLRCLLNYYCFDLCFEFGMKSTAVLGDALVDNILTKVPEE
jgi:hypothetical protein